LEKTPLNHRITLTYNASSQGEPLAQAIIKYINTNNFFAELTKTSMDNAKERIEANNFLVEQIDQIVSSYSDQMARSSTASAEGKILLDNEERLDITGLFELKNALIRDTEHKKIELIEQKEPITIINFGRPQKIIKQFFTKTVVQIPLILIGLFFLLDVLRYLNRKAMEHPSN
jgi:sensor c-di-GMP phosphodiesterase-like protein